MLSANRSGAPKLLLALFLGLWLEMGCRARHPMVDFQVDMNPFGKAPQAGRARLKANRAVKLSKLMIQGGVTSQLPAVAEALEHEFVVLGFYPGQTHKVSVEFHDLHGQRYQTPWLEVKTPPLPVDFPHIVCRSSSYGGEGGYLLLSVALKERDGALPTHSYLVLCGPHGKVLWYLRLKALAAEVLRTPQGMLIQDLGNLSLMEMDFWGQTQKVWQANGLRPAAAGAIPVATDTLHHDFCPDGQGGFWSLGTVRQGQVIDDQILHFSSTGKMLQSLPLSKNLDPKRNLYPDEFNFWQFFYGPGVKAWGHANCLEIKGQEALVSLRLQDAVVLLDLADGKPRWILGRPEGWNQACRQLLLKPEKGVQWPHKQHSARWTRQGTLVLFDNGLKQSRVVEYRVHDGRVSQVWSYQESPPFFSPFLSEVDELPRTGNFQITDGSHISPQGHHSGRILEVSHQHPPRKVLELEFYRPGTGGCDLYRCQRLNGLY